MTVIMVQIHCGACSGAARGRGIATVTDGPTGIHLRRGRRRILLRPVDESMKHYFDDVESNVPLNVAKVGDQWLSAAADDPIMLTCRHHGIVSALGVDVTEAISAWRSDPKRRVRHLTAQPV